MFKTEAEIYRRDRAPWLGRIRDRGFQARCQGRSRGANPYRDDVNPRGGVNFNRARWRAWDAGWEAADKAIAELPPALQEKLPEAGGRNPKPCEKTPCRQIEKPCEKDPGAEEAKG